jgi:hypothetical protein
MGTSHSKNVLDLKAELEESKKVNSRLRGHLHLTRERLTANMASHLALQGGDPRWDEHAFAEWLLLNKEGHYAICLVRVGYLRRLAHSGGSVQRRGDIPKEAKVYGLPPERSQIFVVSAPYLSSDEHDPRGDMLRQLIQVLDSSGSDGERQANNRDVVFWYPLSMHQRPFSSSLQEELHDQAVEDIFRIHTFSTVRRVILPHVPSWKLKKSPAFTAFRKGWLMFENILGAYCQQIVNSYEPKVKEGLDPTRLSGAEQLFRHELTFQVEKDRMIALSELQRACAMMTPVPRDDEGFRAFCINADIAWLTVGYVRELAGRGGPFPRRQELDRRPESSVVGVVPPGRKFVVSHCWESEFHPSPSGKQFLLLIAELDKLGASDTDHVFYDYCSLFQASLEMRSDAYFKANGGSAHREYGQVWYTLSGRAPFQERCFRNALWEMGRLYSFKGCEVVVIPDISSPETFPGGPEMWGFTNTDAYERRGWCVAEYSIARLCGRIKNGGNPKVRAIDAWRKWPETVSEYATMMEETGEREVSFTCKGDREVVKYNFFKMCFNMLGDADEARITPIRTATSVEVCAESQSLRVLGWPNASCWA